MWGEELSAAISLFILKSTKETARFNVPINNTYALHNKCTVEGLNLDVFWKKLYQLRFCPAIPPNSSPKEKFKIPNLPGVKPGTAACRDLIYIREKTNCLDQDLNLSSVSQSVSYSSKHYPTGKRMKNKNLWSRREIYFQMNFYKIRFQHFL